MMNMVKKKNKVGRPVKTIDWKLVEKLCYIQCTEQEIADFVLVDITTLKYKCKKEQNMDFSCFYAQKKGQGKISLRRRISQAIDSGDPRYNAILIFAAKNLIGWKDYQEVKHEGSIQLESIPDKILQKILEIKDTKKEETPVIPVVNEEMLGRSAEYH
jgi:hypothetical protein